MSAAKDEDVLDFATKERWIVVTHDDDFLRLADERQVRGESFAPVVFGVQRKLSIGEMIADLEIVVKAATMDELAGWVLHLPL